MNINWSKPLLRLCYGLRLPEQLPEPLYLIVTEFSSILASLLGFLPSLDHLVRPRQHIRWNSQADLLRRF
jgi:hypothetical protein